MACKKTVPLSALSLLLWLAAGCAPGANALQGSVPLDDRPVQGPSSLPGIEVIAEWTFIDRTAAPTPIVRVFSDGRVEVSSDLLYGGGPIEHGNLTPNELARFQEAIGRLTHGIPQEPIAFSEAYGRRHRLIIRTAEGEGRIQLTTSMRFIELGGIGEIAVPIVWTVPKSAGTWTEVDGGTRFEALRRLAPEQVALRSVWVEVESELLRAAGHALHPGDAGPPKRVYPIGIR